MNKSSMIAAAALILVGANSHADSYISVGAFQSEFAGSEFDREYKSDVNNIQQLKFGYKDRKLAEFFGGATFDEDNKVRDYLLSIALDDTIIHLERGKISGDIVSDNGQDLGEFDNDFIRFNILDNKLDAEGFSIGVGFQRYAVPHLFEYNDGTTQGPMLQDDELTFTSIGLGFFYDPIYNFLRSDEMTSKTDWYFATSGLAISLAQAKASDAEPLKQRGVEEQTWYLWGNSATYELGLFYGMKNQHLRFTANIGYHIRANTFFNIDPSEAFAMEAERNDILLDSHQTILHGLTAAVSLVF